MYWALPVDMCRFLSTWGFPLMRACIEDLPSYHTNSIIACKNSGSSVQSMNRKSSPGVIVPFLSWVEEFCADFSIYRTQNKQSATPTKESDIMNR